MIIITLLAAIINTSAALVAYDCEAQNTNISTIALLEVGPCDIESRKPVILPTYIQLLQLSRYTNVHVQICRVSIDQTVSHCGMHSHTYAVHNGEVEYVEDISHET